MQYISYDSSPLGELLLAADDIGLIGLWFVGQKYFAGCLLEKHTEKEVPVLRQTKHWLTLYFSGKEPDFMPPLHLIGTAFQKQVWTLLSAIPYGAVTTYGALAKQLAAQRQLSHMSPQAVGSAVGHNEISILIPCHRVVGANGSLTGYAAGLETKKALLTLEQLHHSRTNPCV